MPKKSRKRSSSSSSSSRKKRVNKIKGVAMPAHHIQRIVKGKKDMYTKFGFPFNDESDMTAVLKQLRFKKPDNPDSFWGNIYTLEDAARLAMITNTNSKTAPAQSSSASHQNHILVRP